MKIHIGRHGLESCARQLARFPVTIRAGLSTPTADGIGTTISQLSDINNNRPFEWGDSH
jgi:hypothetical protein